MKTDRTQVSPKHYDHKYESRERFLAYHYQIESIRKRKPRDLLEIGVGSNLVGNHLRQQGYQVFSFDFDENLNPDIVGDCRHLPFTEKYFDAISCFQVLEHISYDSAIKVLKELKTITKQYCFISVPYSCLYLNINGLLGLPGFQKDLNLGIRLPFFWISGKWGNPQHKWELGRKNYSKRRFLSDIRSQGWTIEEKKHIALNTQHYFLVLNNK